jgi:hypothetical protein
MKKFTGSLFVFHCILCFIFGGCEETETTDTVSGNLDLTSPGGLEFATVETSASDSLIEEIAVSKDEISGSEEYVVIPYLTGSTDGIYADTATFDITFSAIVNGSDYGEVSTEETEDESEEETTESGTKRKAPVKADLVFGDSHQFFFTRDGAAIERDMTAKVRSVGTLSVILADEEDLDAAEEAGDETLDEAIIEIAEKIEDLILPRMNTLFGEAYSEASALAGAGGDAVDGLISVVLTSRLNDSDVLALFHRQDMLPYDSLLNPTANQQFIWLTQQTQRHWKKSWLRSCPAINTYSIIP